MRDPERRTFRHLRDNVKHKGAFSSSMIGKQCKKSLFSTSIYATNTGPPDSLRAVSPETEPNPHWLEGINPFNSRTTMNDIYGGKRVILYICMYFFFFFKTLSLLKLIISMISYFFI